MSGANCLMGKCLEEIVCEKNVHGMSTEKNVLNAVQDYKSLYVAVVNIDSHLSCLHLLMPF